MRTVFPPVSFPANRFSLSLSLFFYLFCLVLVDAPFDGTHSAKPRMKRKRKKVHRWLEVRRRQIFRCADWRRWLCCSPVLLNSGRANIPLRLHARTQTRARIKIYTGWSVDLTVKFRRCNQMKDTAT